VNVEVKHKPSFATVFASVEPGEVIIAEADAMASMSSNTKVTTRLNGAFLLALMLRIFGKESLFVNVFTALTGSAEIVFTQATPGDIHAFELKGTALFLQPGAFIARTAGVRIGVGWAGFASWIGGEGLFRLRVSGHGTVWFGAYGSIYERDVTTDYIVDTGHLVGYEPTIGLSAKLAGGLFSSFFSGEGLVTRVRGPGKIFLQSRSMGGLLSWTNGHLY